MFETVKEIEKGVTIASSWAQRSSAHESGMRRHPIGALSTLHCDFTPRTLQLGCVVVVVPVKFKFPLCGALRLGHFAATHVGAGPLHSFIAHTSGAALEMMNPLSLMNVAVESWLKPSERSGAWPLTCAVSSGDKLGDPVFVTEGDVLGLAEFEALGDDIGDADGDADGDNNGELDGDALNVRREGIVLKKRQLPNIAHTTIATRTHARENIFQRSTDARF